MTPAQKYSHDIPSLQYELSQYISIWRLEFRLRKKVIHVLSECEKPKYRICMVHRKEGTKYYNIIRKPGQAEKNWYVAYNNPDNDPSSANCLPLSPWHGLYRKAFFCLRSPTPAILGQ